MESASEGTGMLLDSGDCPGEPEEQGPPPGRHLKPQLLLVAAALLGVGSAAALSCATAGASSSARAHATSSDTVLLQEAHLTPTFYKNAWCPGHSNEEFSSLQGAIQACQRDDCGGIYSPHCDEKYGLSLCPKPLMHESSGSNSCVLRLPESDWVPPDDMLSLASHAHPPPTAASPATGPTGASLRPATEAAADPAAAATPRAALVVAPLTTVAPAASAPKTPRSVAAAPTTAAPTKAAKQFLAMATAAPAPSPNAPSPTGSAAISARDRCSSTVLRLLRGMCKSRALQPTCPALKMEQLGACFIWSSTMELSVPDQQQRIQRCTDIVQNDSARLMGRQAKAVCKQESKLCFECHADKCQEESTEQHMQRLRKSQSDGLQKSALSLGGTQGAVHPPDGSAQHCRLLDTPAHSHLPVQRRVRREINRWSDQDFEQFSKAVKLLHEKGLDYFVDLYPQGASGGNGPWFWPWHRRLAFDLETKLQVLARNCSLTLPYWNSNLEASAVSNSTVWSAARFGGHPEASGGTSCSGARPDDGTGYCLQDGIAAGWTVQASAPPGSCDRCVHRAPKAARLEGLAPILGSLQEASSYGQANDYVENNVHAMMHAGILSGDMGDVKTAVWDPIFLPHVAYVDRLFSWWQEFHTARMVNTSTCPDCNRPLSPFEDAISDWMGRWSPDGNCVLLPQDNPRACVHYEMEIPIPE